MIKEKVKCYAKRTVDFFFNPRFLLCICIGWIITNGWSYLCFAIGTYFEVKWLIAVSGAYIAFLWFPFTPEKLVTLAIAIWLLKLLFPKDRKTLAVLIKMKEKVISSYEKRKKKKNSEEFGNKAA